MSWLEVVGWAGSALLVVSLVQTRLVRLRVLNSVACVVLVGYNAALGVWPMVAMNVVLVAINAWALTRLLRERHDARVYDAVPVAPGEPLLAHLLERHLADVARLNPQLAGVRTAELVARADHAFLVTTGDQLVGMVLAADGARPDEQVVLLDHVLPPYRDLTPGEFVFRPDGPFAALGARRVVVPAAPPAAHRYLAGVGFRPEGEGWVLELARPEATAP